MKLNRTTRSFISYKHLGVLLSFIFKKLQNSRLRTKKRLNEIYSKHTGKSVDEIKSALERDNFMTPDNAKDFGLIDKVVEKRE